MPAIYGRICGEACLKERGIPLNTPVCSYRVSTLMLYERVREQQASGNRRQRKLKMEYIKDLKTTLKK